MEHSFPNTFYNKSFGEPAIEPSVATPPADENVPDSPEPTLGSPPSTPCSNVSAPEPVTTVEETPTSPEEHAYGRSQGMRQPPVVLSYHSLGDSIEMQAQINAINNPSLQPA